MRARAKNFVVRAAASGGISRVMAAGLVLVAIMSHVPALRAQESGGAPPNAGPQGVPKGLPPPNYPTSPHRGVIDGWTGKPIPCRCRFDGQSFELGSIVCMSTHLGIVLTRCDIVGNNTSWMPSREPCTPKVAS